MEPFWEKMGLSTEPQMWRASELLDCLRQHFDLLFLSRCSL